MSELEECNFRSWKGFVVVLKFHGACSSRHRDFETIQSKNRARVEGGHCSQSKGPRNEATKNVHLVAVHCSSETRLSVEVVE